MESESRKTIQKEKKQKNIARNRSRSEGVQMATVPHEDANSFLENIKVEWSLFWAGLVGDDEKIEAPEHFAHEKIHVLNIEQIKQITRALSQDRKRINQRIEQVNKEIELNSERLESIKLVGGDQSETIEAINKLSDVGQKLTFQLEKVSGQLERFRCREDELKGL